MVHLPYCYRGTSLSSAPVSDRLKSHSRNGHWRSISLHFVVLAERQVVPRRVFDGKGSFGWQVMMVKR